MRHALRTSRAHRRAREVAPAVSEVQERRGRARASWFLCCHFEEELKKPCHMLREARMLFDFTEPERNVARNALEIYLSDLREEIVKTEKHEWLQSLHEEEAILKRVIEQLSV